jgi:hypothetical protein
MAPGLGPARDVGHAADNGAADGRARGAASGVRFPDDCDARNPYLGFYTKLDARDRAMRLRQEARVLKGKALSSLVSATESFNSPRDDGRVTRVLLHLQHAFEMLLKAGLIQAGVSVFDRKTGRSIGFEKCVSLAMAEGTIKLCEADAGALRAIDAMRDDEQHWFNEVPEQLLYLHARAAVTLFDDVLQRAFGEHLAGYLPSRVLPVSAEPPRELAILLDDEYSQIAALLRPGRRARHQARARSARQPPPSAREARSGDDLPHRSRTNHRRSLNRRRPHLPLTQRSLLKSKRPGGTLSCARG